MIRNRKIILSILFFISVFSSIAQTTFNGTVLDADSKESLPFVNIGIRNKNIGTPSSADGTFTIQIPNKNETDTLSFSMVGYSDLNISLSEITSSNQTKFYLKRKLTELKSVTISSAKLVENEFGIKTKHILLNFSDGSMNQDDIFEIAQLIHLGNSLSRIISLNLLVYEQRKDSGTFRINFYRFDGQRPAERIIEKSIVQKLPIVAGWFKFDLSKYDIYLKGDFIVAIEFIPTEKKSDPIYYGVKLGGSSRSFCRSSSLGEWTVPPHHYRMYITALVSKDKKLVKVNEDTEELETKPAVVLYSKFVRDSFAVFVNLPVNYSKKKNQKFPVFYILDGNAYFDIVSNYIKDNKINAIVVGLGYKDVLLMDSLRDRDYTYPDALPEDSFKVSGGAEKYLKYISSELVPYIDSTYRCDTNNRIIMGHSLGGYFVLYALLQSMNEINSTFKEFAAASPSLDYRKKYIMNEFGKCTGKNLTNYKLVLTYGGREDMEEGSGTQEIDNFNSLVEIFSDEKFKNVKVSSEVFPTFGHMETAIPSFNKGIKEME